LEFIDEVFMGYFLSKSDFMLAHDCPSKLYYKKRKYPSVNDEDEYLQHLARGGYMVGKYAVIHFPGGIQIETGGDHAEAVRLTKEYLERKNVILFEAAVESGDKLVRVDILVKKDDNVKLIEVKSKSYDSGNDPDDEMKALDDYILDAAYQYYVMKEAYPQFRITPFLYLPDKNKNTLVEGLNLLFCIREEESTSSFRKYEVDVEQTKVTDILNDDLMTLVDVSERVIGLQPLVKEESDLLLESFRGGIHKISGGISKDCFSCEFSVTDTTYPVSGFDECWEGFPQVEHHIKDLYHIGTLGGRKQPLANTLIGLKKVNLFDIPEDELTGKRGLRQLIQLKNTRDNKEWMSKELKGILNKWKYPLYFIDFETTLTALPFHKGMRPYEISAFQWSCHTIEKPGAEPVHSEWINLEPSYPNFKFASTLMEQIGRRGTPLMWSSYENTILRMVYEQMDKFRYKNTELKKWLEYIVKFDKIDTGGFTDMNRLALEHYFHPAMKGKTSIKWTLPAVLQSFNSHRIADWLKGFEEGLSLYRENPGRGLINPYKHLPPVEVYERAESVADGTGAMRAYEDLMFGLKKGDTAAMNEYRQALLRYCKLDTLAMVIIWEHWMTVV
jgi:hypothetical protein